MHTHLTARVLRVWNDRRRTKWQGMIGVSSTHSVGLTDGRCNGRRNLREKIGVADVVSKRPAQNPMK
jgi:hypothetical protein